MKTIYSNYIQFANLISGDKITLKQFHNIFNGGSSITIKDNSIRGAKTVSYWDVKVGDRVNNGTRFIEIIANTVINRNGYELDFDAVAILMDDEIREELHSKLAPCTAQEFFTAYEKAHEEVYNEEWELSKANPIW